MTEQTDLVPIRDSALVIEGDFTKEPDDSWRVRLMAARDTLAKRTIPAFIEFCQEVHAFRQDCDGTQGGSEFSRKGCEWLGCSIAQLSYWDAVGRRSPELLTASEKLPVSERAISDLARLDDIAFRKALPKVQADMTQKQVRELIKEINPPRAKPEPNPKHELLNRCTKVRKAFEALPENGQFVVGRHIISYYRDKGWELP
jgi:hypothetical protein